MKLLNKIIPTQLFRSKKSRRSVSRSNPSSFSSGSSATESKSGKGIPTTPTSVLPATSPEINGISGDLSEMSLSPDIYVELVQVFKMMDKDGDGKITRKELEAVLSRVGGAEPPSEEEIVMMLGEVDRDGDGCISLEEFGAISAAFGPPSCRSELRDAFGFFDADHDGRITAEELRDVFDAIGDERCTLEDCRRMIRGVDKNGDGFVCFEDFARMMELQR